MRLVRYYYFLKFLKKVHKGKWSCSTDLCPQSHKSNDNNSRVYDNLQKSADVHTRLVR